MLPSPPFFRTGGTAMGHRGKREYLKAIYARYHRSSKADKHLILDEFCKVTRYHRKSALRLLNGPPPERSPRRKRPRKV